jgi:hypothetical protein
MPIRSGSQRVSQNNGRDRGAAVVPGEGLVEVRAVVVDVAPGRLDVVGPAAPFVQAAATSETAIKSELSGRMGEESTGGLTCE